MLYLISAGESCVLTTACILAEKAFRQFVLAAYSGRLIDLLRVVDDVAFGRMDMHLAERLLSLFGDRNDIQTTHRTLASELGTAREVISRVLNDFQKRNMILQPRGRITLLDKTSLQKLCTPS